MGWERKQLRVNTKRLQAKGKVKRDKIGKRICLKCDKPFKSLWEGNRICPACEAKNSRLDYEEFSILE